jgi:hypothetical protein
LPAIALLPVPVDTSKSLVVVTLVHISTCCRTTTDCHFSSKQVATLLPPPAVTSLLIVTSLPDVRLPIAHILINYELPIYFTARYNVISSPSDTSLPAVILPDYTSYSLSVCILLRCQLSLSHHDYLLAHISSSNWHSICLPFVTLLHDKLLLMALPVITSLSAIIYVTIIWHLGSLKTVICVISRHFSSLPTVTMLLCKLSLYVPPTVTSPQLIIYNRPATTLPWTLT